MINRFHKLTSISNQHLKFRSLSSLTNRELLEKLKLDVNGINNGGFNGNWFSGGGNTSTMINPSNNSDIGKVSFCNLDDYNNTLIEMNKVKHDWANVPAPLRGEVVRVIGEKLRANLDELGAIVSTEMGKIKAEGIGEVQEAVDICDFAVGLSRQLNGSVIPSERPGHLMMERYNPLMGHVGIITAFNFPVAPFFWNLALSLVCGNTNLWKPHETTSLTSIAVMKLVAEALEETGHPGAIVSLLCGGGSDLGNAIIRDPTMELVSFTGSTEVGRHVGTVIAERFGKRILELGGNNAMIVDDSADIDMAVRATLFGSVGTAGQRCTTQRRVLVHTNVKDAFLSKLLPAYESVQIGDPLDPSTLCGPLHSPKSVELFKNTVNEAVEQGGKILCGGAVIDSPGNFVKPAVIEIKRGSDITREERFVPVLYVMEIDSIDEAIAENNAVTHGLSSSLFSHNLNNIYNWIGATGSDCGIVNVNIGTSGAEIGGAFGGEKATGGGRESGSDAWKQYMRRSTITMNCSTELPLAQGIKFD